MEIEDHLVDRMEGLEIKEDRYLIIEAQGKVMERRGEPANLSEPMERRGEPANLSEPMERTVVDMTMEDLERMISRDLYELAKEYLRNDPVCGGRRGGWDDDGGGGHRCFRHRPRKIQEMVEKYVDCVGYFHIAKSFERAIWNLDPNAVIDQEMLSNFLLYWLGDYFMKK